MFNGQGSSTAFDPVLNGGQSATADPAEGPLSVWPEYICRRGLHTLMNPVIQLVYSCLLVLVFTVVTLLVGSHQSRVASGGGGHICHRGSLYTVNLLVPLLEKPGSCEHEGAGVTYDFTSSWHRKPENVVEPSTSF